jgi:hypothetical protein
MDETGRSVPAGVYYARVSSSERRESARIVIVR